jgi:HK97 family phage prohead protease
MNKIFIKAQIEKSAGEKAYRFLASTSSIDRQGDSIDQSGWELKNFMNNPVMLWAHRYDELPLGKVNQITINENGMEAEMVFAEEDANPKAQQVKKLVDAGILNAVSVGFIPKERNGNIITRAELLEISIVPVPANQDALALAYKDMDLAVKKDIEEMLSKGEETANDINPNPTDLDASNGIIEPLVADTEVKSGRVISQKNRKALEGALTALKTAISEIEGLLALVAEVSGTENADEKSGEYVVISKNVLLALRDDARYNDKVSEKLLSSLKEILKELN